MGEGSSGKFDGPSMGPPKEDIVPVVEREPLPTDGAVDAPPLASEEVHEGNESERLLAAFDRVIAQCEAECSLDHLMSLTGAQEAIADPVRKKAKLFLPNLVSLVNRIEKDMSIPLERRNKALADYRRISRAIGMINSGKCRHD